MSLPEVLPRVVSYDFPWKGPLGLAYLDSPDTDYIIPHLPCRCKKKSLQETFIL